MRVLVVVFVAACLLGAVAAKVAEDDFDRIYRESEEALKELESNDDAEFSKMRMKETTTKSPIACILEMTCTKVKQPLTPQDIDLLMAENQGIMRRLNVWAFAQMVKVMDRLKKNKVYVHVSSPIPDGHALRYTVVQGDAKKVAKLAGKYKVRAFDGQFEVEPLEVSKSVRSFAKDETKDKDGKLLNPADEDFQRMNASETEHARRTAPAAAKKVEKPLSEEEKSKLRTENEAAYQDLDYKVHDLFKNLLGRLYSTRVSTYIQLYNPIKNGHIVDYKLVRGQQKALERFAKKLKLKVTATTIEAPGSEVAATAEEGSLEPEEVTEGTLAKEKKL